MNQSIKKVVALEYNGESAPVVTAKGEGLLAEEILHRAKMYDIPVQQQSELVHYLSQVELGDEIPETLFLAVAQVLAFAYLLKGKFPIDHSHTPTIDTCESGKE